MANSTQESQWVLRGQYGDREALELLLRSIQPALHRYVRRLVGEFHTDDVLQDVLVVIARKLKWLNDPNLLRPWAFRIATRIAFRHLKRERRWQHQPLEESELEEIPAPDIVAPDALLQELLTITSISPASRAVLVLHFGEEMSLTDVASILDIPLGTAKSRLAYGLAAIRKQLKNKGRL